MEANAEKFFPLGSSIKLGFHSNFGLVSGNQRMGLWTGVFLLCGDRCQNAASELF